MPSDNLDKLGYTLSGVVARLKQANDPEESHRTMLVLLAFASKLGQELGYNKVLMTSIIGNMVDDWAKKPGKEN
jgi:hypothetical protein